jgi:TRAP-type C4-dicarboxylate transport system permease small subunit
VSLSRARVAFEGVLELILFVLVIALTAVVVAGFVFRYVGQALVWYDETASILLVWLTYYGSALAALKGAHIGVPALVNALPPAWRMIATIVAEACVFGFFFVLAATGFQVLVVLLGDRMVSLPWMPLWLTQSAVPVGAVLFIIAEALRFPSVLADARRTGFVDAELREAIELASSISADSPADGGERRR